MTPDDRPMPRPRPVLVYDGDCGFCTSTVRWLERTMPRLCARADVVAWQHADLATLGLSAAEARASVRWVEPGGRISSGAQACARALVEAGGRWALLGRLLLAPPVSLAAEVGYRLVAANRSRLPGGTPACALPAADRPGFRRRP